MRSVRASFLFLVAVLSLAGCRKPDSDLGLGLTMTQVDPVVLRSWLVGRDGRGVPYMP